MRCRLLVLCCAGLVACSGGTGTDAGADGAVEADASAAPLFPWLEEEVPVELAPCPDGWQELETAGGARACDPFGDVGPETCPPDQTRFVGGAGCERIGPVCPADGLPADLPADAPVTYVLAGAAGGDGTRAAPFGSPTDFAWGGLGGGAVVALGRGGYDTVLRLPSGVSVVGACVAETLVHSSIPPADSSVVDAVRGPCELRALTIDESERQGVDVAGSGDLLLEDVLLRGARSLGLLVRSGGRLTARRVVVRDMRSRSDGEFGRALHVIMGGTADVTRATFERSREGAVFALGEGTRVTLTDVALVDTMGQEGDGRYGRGLDVESGAVASATRVLIDRSREVGILVADAGAALTFEDLVVRDTLGRDSDGTLGRGLAVDDGAVASGRRMVLARNRSVSILVHGAGAQLDLTDAIISESLEDRSTSLDGRGASIQAGAVVSMERVLVERSNFLGILVNEMGSALTFADLSIRDSASGGGGGDPARGIAVQATATLDGRRMLVARSEQFAVYGSTGANLTLEDTALRGVVGAPCDGPGCAGFGVGVAAYDDARAELGGFLVADASLCGVHLARGGFMLLSDGEVRGNAIGACVQVAGYDTAQLTDDVRFVDNETNLEATELPVPDAASPIAL